MHTLEYTLFRALAVLLCHQLMSCQMLYQLISCKLLSPKVNFWPLIQHQFTAVRIYPSATVVVCIHAISTYLV